METADTLHLPHSMNKLPLLVLARNQVQFETFCRNNKLRHHPSVGFRGGYERAAIDAIRLGEHDIRDRLGHLLLTLPGCFEGARAARSALESIAYWRSRGGHVVEISEGQVLGEEFFDRTSYDDPADWREKNVKTPFVFDSENKRQAARIAQLEREAEEMQLVLRSIEAATDLRTARTRALMAMGRNGKLAVDHNGDPQSVTFERKS